VVLRAVARGDRVKPHPHREPGPAQAREALVRKNSNRQADKFHKKGKLLPRERIAMLIDRGAPFVALSTLAGLKMHDDDGGENAAGGGGIGGIGFVSGVRCLVSASDSAIKGGAITPMGLKKSLRGQELALENKLPIVTLVESGGANLNYQSEIFVDGGRVFHNMARLSAAGAPVTAKWLGAPALTVIWLLVTVIELFTVSVAVIVPLTFKFA